MTAVIANCARLDGIEVLVQHPNWQDEELAYSQETMCESSTQREEARGRVLELLHHLVHLLGYKKRTEMALDIVQQLEQEGHFPSAHYAFDHGVLSLELSRGIEHAGNTGSVSWNARGRSNGRANGNGLIPWPERCGRRIQKVFVPSGALS